MRARAPPGGCRVCVSFMATIAHDTASAAASHGQPKEHAFSSKTILRCGREGGREGGEEKKRGKKAEIHVGNMRRDCYLHATPMNADNVQPPMQLRG